MPDIPFRQIHLDFHNSERIPDIGCDFNPDEFIDIMKKAHVESINCFAKCVHGMLYYETDHPAKHPGLKRDLLREQINACHKAGIRAPIYLCGGWDEFAARHHADWMERDTEGKPYGAGPLEAPRTPFRKLCFNTPYIEYFTSQIKEILEKFAGLLDGLFIDISWQDPCCCSYCLDGMESEGLDPQIEADRMKFAAIVLQEYKDAITRLVRMYDRNCTLFFNSGHIGPCIRSTLSQYTHLEIESLPSEAGTAWGYTYLPVTARYARIQGKEFVGMTGKFHMGWGDFGGYKNKAALEYECLQSIVLGGKCIIGDQLHPGGLLDKPAYEMIGEIYGDILLKEEWCAGVRPVSEIAVVHPEAIAGGNYSHNVNVMPLAPSLIGLYRMLEEEHYQFDVVDDNADLNLYRAVILPDIITLNEEFKNKLEKYVMGGGKLLLSYKSGMDPANEKFVLQDLGIEYLGESDYSPDYIKVSEEIDNGIPDLKYVMYEKGFRVRLQDGARELARVWNPYFNRNYRNYCSHYQTPVDRESEYPAISVNKDGNMVYIAYPLFDMYDKYGSRVYKKVFANCLELLLKGKMLYTDAPTTAHINLNFQPAFDRYVLHILNYIPEPRTRTICTIEDVIPLYGISIGLKLPDDIKNVYCAPSKTRLEFVYEGGYIKTVVPKVCGHEMVVFERFRQPETGKGNT